MATTVVIPDIGISGEVTVIEVPVKVGERIEAEQSILTLEGEKASMEIPTPSAGIIASIVVKVGDQVKTGSVILTLESESVTKSSAEQSSAIQKNGEQSHESVKLADQEQLKELPDKAALEPAHEQVADDVVTKTDVYASPMVRRLARELAIDLAELTGTGHKNRLQKSDLLTYIKTAMKSREGNKTGSGLPQAPVIDFSQFGEIVTQALSKIKKYTAQNLYRNWLLIPHVTQFDEADITELEVFRKAQQAKITDVKLTPLVFLIKAIIATLKKFPAFNASLAADGEQLILKKYFHIGVAVDTAEGLVVPVIRDADQKSLLELAQILAQISAKARAKQLTPADMQGSSFTLSSLGGIGGAHFTPIVNLPNTAILGISKATIKPVYQTSQFVPRLMLPLSLSYDHRVIDGAEGARFMVQLTQYLSDIRLILL